MVSWFSVCLNGKRNKQCLAMSSHFKISKWLYRGGVAHNKVRNHWGNKPFNPYWLPPIAQWRACLSNKSSTMTQVTLTRLLFWPTHLTTECSTHHSYRDECQWIFFIQSSPFLLSPTFTNSRYACFLMYFLRYKEDSLMSPLIKDTMKNSFSPSILGIADFKTTDSKASTV